MITVKDFTRNKVADYLRTGRYRNVLIVFHHGLGDAVMAYPNFRRLRRMFPAIRIDVDFHLGQEEIYGRPEPGRSYDICFDLPFPVSEWRTTNRTKAENSCIEELGVPVPAEDYRPPREVGSSFVATHFFSTCSRELCCPENFARQLHDQIADAGFIPIDTHMRHATAEPRNRPYDWQTCRIYEQPATCGRLFGAIKSCAGFVGVASGNFWAALAVLPPERILFIKTSFGPERLTHLKVASIDAGKPYDRAAVDRFLRAIGKKAK